jgi:hypothetical protein
MFYDFADEGATKTSITRQFGIGEATVDRILAVCQRVMCCVMKAKRAFFFFLRGRQTIN